MKRSAVAVWHGDGQSGSGTLDSQSGVLNQQPYSFNTRFISEDGKAGTNPEELIAAAHAGCFTMALSFMLASAGFKADELKTQASVNVEMKDGGYVITGIELSLTAKIPGIDKENFQSIASKAKENCPVSKALAAVPISLKASMS